MRRNSKLRRQVEGEKKLQSYIFSALGVLLFVYLGSTFLIGDMGLAHYYELKQKHGQLKDELAEIKTKNSELSSVIDSYMLDPFYVEKNARENFGLAGKDEVIFYFKAR